MMRTINFCHVQRKFLFILFFSLWTSMTFAYMVYNHTDHDIAFKDIYGFRGLSGFIPKGGQLECKSIFGGCSGKLWLYVYESFNNFRVLCHWEGDTNDAPGTYFVIKNTPLKSYPSDNWCQFEYHTK